MPRRTQTKVKWKRFSTSWWLGVINPAGTELSVYTRNDPSSQISIVQILASNNTVRDGVSPPTEDALNYFLTAVQNTYPDVVSVTTKLTEYMPGDVITDLDDYEQIG